MVKINQLNNVSQTTRSKKHISRDKKREALKKSVKEHESSSSDESDYYYDSDISMNDTDSSYNFEDDNGDFDKDEYRKFLYKIFPSKYLDSEIKKNERDSVDKKEVPVKSKKQMKKRITPTLISKKKVCKNDEQETENNVSLPSNEDSYDFENDTKSILSEDNTSCDSDDELSDDVDSNSDFSGDEDDSDDESYDSEDIKNMLKDNMNFNIVLTIGGKNQDETDTDNDTDADNESEDDTDTELEEVETNGDCERNNIKETDKSNDKITKTTNKNKQKTPTTTTDKKQIMKPKTPESLEDTFKKMMSILDETNDDPDKIKTLAKSQFEKYMEDERKKQQKLNKKADKKQQKENTKQFRKIMREKNVLNDFKYFSKLEPSRQKQMIEELEEVMKHCAVEKPYRISLIESDIPVKYKSSALTKINTLKYMDQGSGEFYKIKQWVDTFMRIPFGAYNNLPVKMSDGIVKCQSFMKDAKETLDNAVYGLNDAKMQIMQMVGQWISNPDAIGTAIAIKGPMGTGKTTLVKEGISKILNRPFAFIALGGATDSSFLEGHSYTYEGSIWGKIVDILIKNKSMNPVIYFDELDKISDTPKGEEIIGILTHLTDTTQNSQFHDKYFSEIDFDLSKALFIFSYNDENKVNPILRDRMYRIQTNGYNSKDKIKISQDYLIPSISKNVNFEKDDINVSDNAIKYIVDNFTNGEKGVRNLQRCLEIIYTKLNLYRLMEKGTKLFDDEEETLDVSFPFNVTSNVVDKLLKKDKEDHFWKHLYT